MGEPFRILVSDDEPAQRELVGGFLSKHGFEVTQAADGRQALARFKQEPFDLVLTDQKMPDLSGLELLEGVRAITPEAAVIILTSDASDEVLLSSFEAGASGYLPKTRAARQVLQAIRLAATGETLISGPTLARVLQYKATAARVADGVPHLTDRELDVLRAMAQGLDTEAIADRYTLTIATTRTYVQVILRKLDAHSRLQAVVRANELGLLR